MKRILITTIAVLLTAAMLAGCGQASTVTLTTLPRTAAPPSATQSVMPSVLPTPFVLPSPKIIPTPTPTIEPTPSPTEQIEIHKTNIPDIIEGDGRNLDHNFYEDDKYLYFYDYGLYLCQWRRLDEMDKSYPSISRINKTTGEMVELLKHCGEFCVEGDYIYWAQDDNKNKRSKYQTV